MTDHILNKTIKFGGGFSQETHYTFMKSLSDKISYIRQKDYILIFSSNGTTLSIEYNVNKEVFRVNNMFSYKLDHLDHQEYITLEKKVILKLVLMDRYDQIKFFIGAFELSR